MNIKALANKVLAAVAAYERRQDYDETAYLFDRVHALERDMAEMQRRLFERTSECAEPGAVSLPARPA